MIELSIDIIKKLEIEYGNPLYIFNKDEFASNYHEIESTFQAIYPDYHICYSFKTNYTPSICSLVKEFGGYAEVVSDMEYELALRLGYKPQKIVFNGPIKGSRLEEHFLARGIINIDRIEEAIKLCSIAKNHEGQIYSVGIRVNFDLEVGYVSRFGIDISQLGDVMSLLTSHGIRIGGLHCHMSRARGLESWLKRVSTMLNLIEEYKLDDLDYVSFGSGMYGHMDIELKNQFPYVPSYQEYGQVAIKKFADYYSGKKKKPLLFTEPGTTLISKYIDFIAKVEGIKEIRGKQFVLLNCSFHNLGETCQMKNLPIKVFGNSEKKKRITNGTFVGYTCLEQDIMYRDYTGEIGIGDYVVFGNVGGYSIVDKPPFILPNCPMVAYENRIGTLIKRKETFEDVFATYQM